MKPITTFSCFLLKRKRGIVTSNCKIQLRAPAPNPLSRWYAGELASKHTWHNSPNQAEQTISDNRRIKSPTNLNWFWFLNRHCDSFGEIINLQAPRAVALGTRLIFTKSRSPELQLNRRLQLSKNSNIDTANPLIFAGRQL